MLLRSRYTRVPFAPSVRKVRQHQWKSNLGYRRPFSTSRFTAKQLLLGDIVPDFTQDSSHGRINFHQFIDGKWTVLFSHPKDYTPVCTTELGRVAKLRKEWEKRDVKVIALSVDDAQSHKAWMHDITETQGAEVYYPIIADTDKSVSQLFSMIHPNMSDTTTVRSVFIISPEKKLMAQLTYPPSVGRNFDEILRIIDALQLSSQYKIATPSDWKVGDDVIISPSINNEQAKQMFPKGWKEVKSYLRLTPDPRN